ncbi:MAG: NAD-dependent epimerase/dehydratase family protein [Hyphomicrobiales bacterium]
MKGTVLVTGGAGFIGRHVATALLHEGHDVRILDALIEQVHGAAASQPVAGAELVRGDIRDPEAVQRALHGVDSVIHLAAEVGVGQSMYAIDRYVGVNDLGTAVLFQALIQAPVRRVVVASSMSIYGEGLYRDSAGNAVEVAERAAGNGHGWDPVDETGAPLDPLPTPEWKQPSFASVYALTKFMQEKLTLVTAPAYGMEACALRLFNVFGPGQALSNPYTGVLAIFAGRLLNGEPPLVFEDGAQRRDFVHVADVAQAFARALDSPAAVGGTFNIGSGRHYSVSQVAGLLADAMGSDIAPEILGKARTGDIRHCFADISLARERLGFEPAHRLEDSLGDLAEWVKRQQATDRVDTARKELETWGLVA